MSQEHSTPRRKRLPKYNLEGRRFGRLVVERRLHQNSYGTWFWRCTCDCGVEKDVSQRFLIDGITRSCGCLRRETTAKLNLRHGLGRPPEYGAWHNMRLRCGVPTTRRYHRYGGRGIKVCDAWQGSFATFLRDMGPRPSPEHSIDRIDNDGDYCPENCRWATKAEQSFNTSRNRRLTYKGRTMLVVDWADEVGLSPKCLFRRLDEYKWTVERAMETPARLVVDGKRVHAFARRNTNSNG